MADKEPVDQTVERPAEQAVDQPVDPTVDQAERRNSGTSTRVAIALVVISVFAGILLAKFLAPTQPNASVGQPVADSVTSIRNDASADYEAAAKTGKPIYVLFHSLS